MNRTATLDQAPRRGLHRGVRPPRGLGGQRRVHLRRRRGEAHQGQRAGSSPATRGTPVDPGDRIVTGTNGMAQLTMVDQARLSLRPSTQFVIEAYGDRRESEQGGVLNLIKGTLRTFTGLIASSNRDRFVMKTRVATVGIRGSGNILYACDDKECDESVSGVAREDGAITVNHTIDGSHAITGLTPATGRTRS